MKNYMKSVASTLVVASLALAACFRLLAGEMGGHLFRTFLLSGRWMSLLFAVMFLLGVFVITERLQFFVMYWLCPATRREIAESGNRTDAMEKYFGGYEPDHGAGLLEYIAVSAPALGFIGTLIGFMASFARLGVGGRLVNVLHDLSFSMITSLLGAIISLIFLAAAFLLRRTKASFDKQFQPNIVITKTKK